MVTTMPSVHDIVHDGVLYARSLWRSKLWGTPLYKPTLLSDTERYELEHLASVMAAAVDRQCTSSLFLWQCYSWLGHRDIPVCVPTL